MMDDRALIEGIRQGDSKAARLFVERYEGIVFGLCLRMLRHRQDAEDVAQETFVRALRALSGFDRDRPLRPWLLGIAANRCRTALSGRSRRPVVVESLDDRADPRRSLDDPDDLAAELERALRRVRPEYRAVFVLYHEHHLPYEEISLAIGRPVGTVKTWIHRARADLADRLGRSGAIPIQHI